MPILIFAHVLFGALQLLLNWVLFQRFSLSYRKKEAFFFAGFGFSRVSVGSQCVRIISCCSQFRGPYNLDSTIQPRLSVPERG